MINKRLLHIASGAMHLIFTSVLLKWLGLACYIILILLMGFVIEDMADGMPLVMLVVCVAMPIFRYFCTNRAANIAARASERVKEDLRMAIYRKLLALYPENVEKNSTAEILQIATEGCEQLEIYFGKYIPQLFYSLSAAITLFVILAFFDFFSAMVLFICVPLIPISIMLIMKLAKKVFAKYWGKYTNLGERFLDNLQGLTTLKVYNTDEACHAKMNNDAEGFRRITMRVLTMQLWSISLMDIMAFGGAALGSAVAIDGFVNGRASLWAAFAVIMLSAEFFIPLRQLGSFFHIAMNGVAASDKIFALLDTKEAFVQNQKPFPKKCDITFSNVDFSYNDGMCVLNGVSFLIPAKSFVSFVGKSGCGKSTIAALIAGRLKAEGVSFSGVMGKDISKKDYNQSVVTVSSNSYIFAGTVLDNLKMACPNARDTDMREALKKVCLFNELGSLDYEVKERGTNLSGGQRQRLAIARALLYNADIYIFDEATSGVDVESEEIIMSVITRLKEEKTVILISHRLYNMKASDMIYVLEQGNIIESGKHNTLIGNGGLYADLFREQEAI